MKATIELTDTVIEALAQDKALHRNYNWGCDHDTNGVMDLPGAYADAYAEGMKDLLKLIKTEANNQN